MSLNESIVEDAALEWFWELGYAFGHGPQFASGEPAAKRDSFGEVVLVGRLREVVRRLNPAIPEDAGGGVARGAVERAVERGGARIPTRGCPMIHLSPAPTGHHLKAQGNALGMVPKIFPKP